MPLAMVVQDTASLQADVIVTLTDSRLRKQDRAGKRISRAGAALVEQTCRKLAPAYPGRRGFGLTWRFVIHVVRLPPWLWRTAENEDLLASAYKESLRLAVEANCESIVLPLIPAGRLDRSKDALFRIAPRGIREFSRRLRP